MHRTYVRRRAVAMALIGALLSVAVPAAATALGGSPVEPRPETYVVASGDTLWDIASRSAPGQDPRPLIEAIEDANGVDAGSLVPGQVLAIPTG